MPPFYAFPGDEPTYRAVTPLSQVPGGNPVLPYPRYRAKESLDQLKSVIAARGDQVLNGPGMHAGGPLRMGKRARALGFSAMGDPDPDASTLAPALQRAYDRNSCQYYDVRTHRWLWDPDCWQRGGPNEQHLSGALGTPHLAYNGLLGADLGLANSYGKTAPSQYGPHSLGLGDDTGNSIGMWVGIGAIALVGVAGSFWFLSKEKIGSKKKSKRRR